MRLLTTAVVAASALLLSASAFAAGPIQATMYKNPQCGCCEGHAEYLEKNGFDVTVKTTHDLPLIKQEQGVPGLLAGCHTIMVGDYVVEGHVSAEIIKRLLAEKPVVRGISLPGMPMGSPGMPGPKTEPFKVFTFGGGQSKLFAVE